MLRAPATPMAHGPDTVDQPEEAQAPQNLRGVEQVPGKHRNHGLLELPAVARMAEHLLQDRTVEAVDKEGEPRYGGALAFFQPAQQRQLHLRLPQRRVHQLRRLLSPTHRQVHAGGKHWIEKREGIADHHPARSAHACRVIRVVAGDAYLVADELRGFQAPPQCRITLERGEEKLQRAAFALLEVIRPAHRSDAHDAPWQRNHPHPAVLEAVDADIARIRPGARLGAAEVAEDRRTLMLPVLATQFVFGGEKSVSATGVDDVARLDLVIRATLGTHPQPAGARCALLDRHDLVALTRAGAAFA